MSSNPVAQVLVVDDHPVNVSLLASVLKRAGFRVLVAFSGEEAIVTAHQQPLDLILLDVMMPGISGYETCLQLKADPATQRIPVIFMTVLDDAANKVKAFAVGGMDYITKPFQEEEVLARVKLHLELKTLTQTLQQQNLQLQQEVAERMAAETSLRQLSQELEFRVHERTTKLTQALEQLQQTQDYLKRSEERVTNILESITDGFMAVDRHWDFTYLNSQAEVLLQRSKAEFLEHHQWDRFATAIGEGFQAECGQVMAAGVTASFEEYYPPLKVWFELHVYPTRDGIAIYFRDVTERRQAEAALRQSEAYLRTVISNVPLILWAIDHQGIFTLLEGKGLERVGLSPGAIVGRSMVEVCRNLPNVVAALSHSLATGDPYHVVLEAADRMIEGWGTAVTNPRGEITGVIGVSVDITERRQAELALQHLNQKLETRVDQRTAELAHTVKQLQQEIWQRQNSEAALRQSEERFRQVAENIQEVFFLGAADGQQILYVSPAYETIWGRPCQSLYEDARSWLESIHPDDQPHVLAASLGQWELGQPYHVEYRVVRPDGGIRWIRSQTVLVPNEAGQLYRIAGIAEDITDRKLANEQLQMSLEEKELLLKEVHHRVKNNLQVIASIFSLQSQYIEDPKILDILVESQNRINAMALIHEKLYQSPSLARIDFVDYIGNLARSLFASYNPRHHQIHLKLQVEPLALNLDTAIRCGLVLNELISNALKYAFPQGQPGEISLNFFATPEGQFCLRVQDNGVGLPPAWDLEQTNTLGLRLVRILTRKLKGHLETHSPPGTTFQITFPPP